MFKQRFQQRRSSVRLTCGATVLVVLLLYNGCIKLKPEGSDSLVSQLVEENEAIIQNDARE